MVFLFLRNVRATLIPSVAVPVSLIGTFGVMYLCHYSIDNLSLMALTISTGFVVDDAIVVIENITRYLEQGMAPMQAALKGASEIGFTVLSISISLVAVFIPILMMGGIVGRLVPRIRRGPLGCHPGIPGHFSNHDADDVFSPAQGIIGMSEHGKVFRASERAFNARPRRSTSAAWAGSWNTPA